MENTESETRFWGRRERSKHNAMERKRRLIIKKHVKKLEECLPNIKPVKGRRFSRILIVQKAISFIKEMSEANGSLHEENLLLAHENTVLQRQMNELLEQRKQAGEVSSETEEIEDSILGSSDSNETSSLFNEAVNFEEGITGFMMDNITQSEFWSLDQEFE
jgi:vacuolar-type H+-ATPase subunit I/STV1